MQVLPNVTHIPLKILIFILYAQNEKNHATDDTQNLTFY